VVISKARSIWRLLRIDRRPAPTGSTNAAGAGPLRRQTPGGSHGHQAPASGGVCRRGSIRDFDALITAPRWGFRLKPRPYYAHRQVRCLQPAELRSGGPASTEAQEQAPGLPCRQLLWFRPLTIPGCRPPRRWRWPRPAPPGLQVVAHGRPAPTTASMLAGGKAGRISSRCGVEAARCCRAAVESSRHKRSAPEGSILDRVPPTTCSPHDASIRSGVTPPYQIPLGKISRIGPAAQMRRQAALLRSTTRPGRAGVLQAQLPPQLLQPAPARCPSTIHAEADSMAWRKSNR